MKKENIIIQYYFMAFTENIGYNKIHKTKLNNIVILFYLSNAIISDALGVPT